MRGRPSRVPAATWIDVARRALIEAGIVGVKVDRLADRLGVSRGGFYHNFRDRDDLLDQLIQHWERTCKFLPREHPGSTRASAVAWLDKLSNYLIEEDGYDHQYDRAVREWARGTQKVAWAVERVDSERLAVLGEFFRALGYEGHEIVLRARVYYYHQIGYYALGVRESIGERRRKAPLFHTIFCGAERLHNTRAKSKKAVRQ